MHSLSILSLAAFLPQAFGWGNAIIQNNCAENAYVWSVGSSVTGPAVMEPYSAYSQEYYYDDKSGGISLKVCTSDDGLYTGAPQTIYAYTLDQSGGQVW